MILLQLEIIGFCSTAWEMIIKRLDMRLILVGARLRLFYLSCVSSLFTERLEWRAVSSSLEVGQVIDVYILLCLIQCHYRWIQVH